MRVQIYKRVHRPNDPKRYYIEGIDLDGSIGLCSRERAVGGSVLSTRTSVASAKVFNERFEFVDWVFFT